MLPAVPAWPAGGGGLERAALRGNLTPEALERIFALGADVLAVEFQALAADPGRSLDAVARLCGTDPFGRVEAEVVNRAQAARSVPLAAAAKLAARAMRSLGAQSLLQALKDEPRLVRLVFRPARPGELPGLSETAAACLDRCQAACRAAVAAACEPLGTGLWLARGGAGGAPASPRGTGSRGGADGGAPVDAGPSLNSLAELRLWEITHPNPAAMLAARGLSRAKTGPIRPPDGTVEVQGARRPL